LVERPHPEWTVARAMQARMQASERPAEAEALLRVPALGKDWRDRVRLKLEPP
jgi:MOSC domain-containing protein YiiM